MNKQNLIDKILLIKPNILISMGFVLIIAIGILGEYFSWSRLPFSPFSNFFGGMVFVYGWLLHLYCHKFHQHAHEQSLQIQSIVVSGPFAKVRHPMYLSIMLMDLALVIAWGIVWMFIPFFLFWGLIVTIMIKEEQFLLQNLGGQYEDYLRQVPWRLVPKIF
jgi:protein-S-isoprenylcysteine O-methyltransferase Ste14